MRSCFCTLDQARSSPPTLTPSPLSLSRTGRCEANRSPVQPPLFHQPLVWVLMHISEPAIFNFPNYFSPNLSPRTPATPVERQGSQERTCRVKDGPGVGGWEVLCTCHRGQVFQQDKGCRWPRTPGGALAWETWMPPRQVLVSCSFSIYPYEKSKLEPGFSSQFAPALTSCEFRNLRRY